MPRRRFARAPRRGNKMTPAMRLAVLARLEADQRFRTLAPSKRFVIGGAVRTFANAEGNWWNPIESDDPTKVSWVVALGVSASTVKRAIRAAIDADGLLTREPYLRPDGRQGSTRYFLDRAIVWPETGQGGSTVTQPVEARAADEPTSRLNVDPAARWVNSDPAENGLGTEDLLSEGRYGLEVPGLDPIYLRELGPDVVQAVLAHRPTRDVAEAILNGKLRDATPTGEAT